MLAASVIDGWGLGLWLTAVIGVLSLFGAALGGLIGLKRVTGWIVGSTAFLLPVLVGLCASVLEMALLNRALARDVSGELAMGDFWATFHPTWVGLALTCACLATFLGTGGLALVVHRRRQ